MFRRQRPIYVVVHHDHECPDWQDQLPHLEVLSERPKWNLQAKGQRLFVANVNGGDSREIHLCQVDGCDQLATEFWETDDDNGWMVCAEHEEDLAQEVLVGVWTLHEQLSAADHAQ